MKHPILFIVILLSLNSTLAQDLEWAPIGAKWWYKYNVGLSGNETTYIMEVIGDTLIQGVNCKVLKQDLIDFNTGDLIPMSHDYIYQSGDTIFYYSKGLEKFSTLYNFDTPIEDTFHILEPGYPHSSDSSIVVWKTEQGIDMLGNDSIRKYQSRNDLTFSDWILSGTIYEVLGNVDKFFLPLYDLGCDGGCPLTLRCYKDDNYEIKLGTSPCEFTTSTILKEKNDPIIYPNPAKSYFMYTASDAEVEYIKIFDVLGREYDIKYQGNSEIDISAFDPGAYWIHLKTKSHLLITKLIIL